MKKHIGTMGGIFLGAVLLLAAWGKAMEPGAFAQQIQLEGLDFLFSATTVVLLALVLETALGVGLVLGIRRRWLLVPASFLVAFFVFLNARNYYLVSRGLRDADATCGCFGKLLERTPAQAFWQDLFLLIPPLALAFLGGQSGFRPFPGRRVLVALTLAVGMAGYAWKNPDLRFTRAAAQIEQESAEEGFFKSHEFLLRIDGREAPGAAIYYSEARSEFLIRAPQLPFPLLLRPRIGAVEQVEPKHLRQGSEEAVQLLPRAHTQPLGQFQIGPEAITFTAFGHEVQMAGRAE